MGNIPSRFPATLTDCLTDFLSPFYELTLRFEMEFSDRLDAAMLEKAVELTLDAEPVLGCRFVDKGRKPCFERLDSSGRFAFLLANSASEYEIFKCTPIDHKIGPLINVCLWPSPDGDSLLIKAAHQVADAAGVREIAAILSGIYRHLAHDRNYRPSPAVDNKSRSFNQVMKHVPLCAYPRICLNCAKSILHSSNPHTIYSLPAIDRPGKPITYISHLISSNRVSVLAEYGHSRNATLNDIFAAALLRALAANGKREGRSHISIGTTVDLRRYAPSGDLRAVANMSSMILEWPDLGTDPGQNFAETLDKVAAITRSGKKYWIGLDIWFTPIIYLFRIMPHASGKALYRKYIEAALKSHKGAHGLTNTGRIEMESVNFGIQPSIAHVLPPPSYPPMPILFGLSGYNGTLTLSSGVCPAQKEVVEKFFDLILKELPV